jgi:hypothetical protein
MIMLDQNARQKSSLDSMPVSERCSLVRIHLLLRNIDDLILRKRFRRHRALQNSWSMGAQ